MNPLESRKQLLLAESDLNRVQLQEEWQALAAEVRRLAERAKTIGSIASSAAMLAAGLAAWWRGKSADPKAKPSWLQRILKGAGLLTTFWMAFRAAGRDQKDP